MESADEKLNRLIDLIARLQGEINAARIVSGVAVKRIAELSPNPASELALMEALARKAMASVKYEGPLDYKPAVIAAEATEQSVATLFAGLARKST